MLACRDDTTINELFKVAGSAQEGKSKALTYISTNAVFRPDSSGAKEAAALAIEATGCGRGRRRGSRL